MTKLHSKILGTGRPLVILHGFLGMSDNWKTLGSKYAEHGFETHLVDQRNHGRSFWSDEFDYDVMSKDLLAYLNHHGIESVSIIGHSMGGKTAMHFACDYSERTEKVLVADIAPKYYPPHHQDIINGLKTLNFEHIKSRGDADKELSKSIPDFGTRQFLLKNLYWQEKGKLAFRFNLDVLGQKMEEIGENISPNALYHGHTLFLRGEKSGYITQNDLPQIKRHFPIATLEAIANTGHWLHAENPGQFFQKSFVFLNS